jgi:hypothetical protein
MKEELSLGKPGKSIKPNSRIEEVKKVPANKY